MEFFTTLAKKIHLFCLFVFRFLSSAGYDVKCNRTTTLVPTKLDFTFRPNQTPCKKMQIRDLIESATAEQYVSTLIKIFNCPFTQLVAKRIYHCCCAYVCMYFVCVWYVYMYLLSVCPLQLMSNIYRKPMYKMLMCIKLHSLL